jgi:FHS family glucose/mannose:H+ symporter-like MFS transporter
MKITSFLCLYSIFVLALCDQVFPSILTSIGKTTYQQGLFLSSLFLLLPFSYAFAGLAADRMGKKAILTIGALFLAIPFAIASQVGNVWIQIASVVLFGVGMGSVEGQASALLSDTHPGKERSILNLSQVFFCFGAAGGPFLISLAFRLIPDLGVPTLLMAAAAVAFSVVLGFFTLKDSHRPYGAVPLSGFKRVLLDKVGRLLLVSMFLYVTVERGIAGWIVKYMEEQFFFEKTAAPFSLTTFWGGMAVSRVIVWLFLPRLRDTHLLGVALLLTLIFQVFIFAVADPSTVLFFLFLFGFGMGTVWPTIIGMVGARFRKSSGSAVGLVAASGAAAVPVIHQVIGILSQERFFGLRASLSGLTLVTALNVFIVYRTERSMKKGGTQS